MSQIVVEPPPASPEPPASRASAPAPPAEPQRGGTGGWSPWPTVLMLFVGLIVFFALMTGMLVIVNHSGRSAPAAGTAAASGVPSSAPLTATVMLTEFSIKPGQVTLAPGGSLYAMNMGTMTHNLAVQGTALATPMISPGSTDQLKLTGLAPGTYTIICQVPGHAAAGMHATLVVAGASPSAAAAGGSPAPSNGATAASADAKIDFSATPGPAWHAFDPTLAPAPGATVHNVTFHITEVAREVAPGVTQQAWTFNGQVPGPILRGHIGDVFNVTVVNDGTMTHSIDFHASQVAPNVAMAPIAPGKSLVYQFKADYAGIWMYHCGTAPAIEHIANGMLGAVVIDPPNLPPVAHEYVMIQSELYLGPQGQPGDLAKMLADTPDAVVFNGYVNQYKYAPIKVDPGQRIRIWVLDAGPSDISSFHIVGTIFDTVFKEGHYELQPGNATGGGSQTLDLLPAQGGFVETTFAQPGVYTMVSHKFADASRGDLGTFDVGGATGTMNH